VSGGSARRTRGSVGARLVGGALLAAAAASTGADAAPLAAQETHALVIVGLGGTDAYRQRFVGWAKALRETLMG
jgi:hypothetical protein